MVVWKAKVIWFRAWSRYGSEKVGVSPEKCLHCISSDMLRGFCGVPPRSPCRPSWQRLSETCSSTCLAAENRKKKSEWWVQRGKTLALMCQASLLRIPWTEPSMLQLQFSRSCVIQGVSVRVKRSRSSLVEKLVCSAPLPRSTTVPESPCLDTCLWNIRSSIVPTKKSRTHPQKNESGSWWY